MKEKLVKNGKKTSSNKFFKACIALSSLVVASSVAVFTPLIVSNTSKNAVLVETIKETEDNLDIILKNYPQLVLEDK